MASMTILLLKFLGVEVGKISAFTFLVCKYRVLSANYPAEQEVRRAQLC